MEIRVPMMIQDAFTSKGKGMRLIETTTIAGEEFFLNGPVTGRVAVLDFDPATGLLLHGAVFQPPTAGRKYGEYRIPNSNDIYSTDFMQVSVFATVMKTLQMFEEADNMGRSLTWSFGAPQLLVVPRAGELANAYYERTSHSLQFFYFPNSREPNKTVFTSLSRDIVSHETAHAILDGIAPHLYDAVTPQSLALHEAIADLSALMMAFRSHELRKTVLDQTGGQITMSTAFNSLAEEFGSALESGGRSGYLRNMLNHKTLCPDDKTLDADGKPNRVDRSEPHDLSEVITGALYSVLVKMHTSLKKELSMEEGKSEFYVSGKALYICSERFKRMTLRALDYLTPGEVSFADYGRAIIACDQASRPHDSQERSCIVDEFVSRCMVPNQDALKVDTNYAQAALDGVDLQSLFESDWYAYDFANRHAGFLSIPAGVPFEVEPRLLVRKTPYQSKKTYEGEAAPVKELILKVHWSLVEPNRIGAAYPDKRRITVGTTLVIDWETHQVRALLTSDRSNRPEEAAELQRDRDQLLRRLADDDLLRIGRAALGPDGHELRSVIRADAIGGVLKVRSMAKMLHIMGRYSHG